MQLLITQAAIKPLRTKHKRMFRLIEDYSFEWLVDGERNRITIYKGFTFDLSSIPRIGYLVISPTDDANMVTPSLVHDALYASAGTLTIGGKEIGRHEYLEDENNLKWVRVGGAWNKKDTDMLFRKMVKLYGPGISSWKLYLIYQAVNWFGKGAW